MKILHILASNKYSGAENVVCQIISMFREEAVEMAYCSPDGEIRNALQERNVKYLPIERLNVENIRQIVAKYKPDIVHAHDMRACYIVSKAIKNKIIINHIHNNAFNSRGISLKSIAYLWASRKAKKIFWVSKSACDGYIFRALVKRKSKVLYNVIDIQAVCEKAKKDNNKYDFDAVFIGRFSYAKNPQKMLEVLEKVVAVKKDFKFAFVGCGELEEEVKSLCKAKGLTENVHFLGFQSNPLKILQDAKVMVMTSRWEGLPMCALEAMALGVPIVSTPTDGMRELIQNGETGYLSDETDGLARRILEIVTDDSLRKKLSQNGLQKSKEVNDIKNYKKELLAAYGEEK